MTVEPEVRRRGRRRFLGFLAGFFLVAGGLWAGFWVLAGLWLGPNQPFWVGIGSLWASLAVIVAVALWWGQREGKRRPDVFGPFNDAFLRIARGDYSVQIPTEAVNGGGPGHAFLALAENLNAMTGSLARVEELRRQFVADVSHEFQSPLTSVLGFAQALRTEDLPPALKDRYLGIIETEARRLSRLADTLLKLNSLEDRAGPPDPRDFRLDVQIRRVLVALEPQWSGRSLEVEALLDSVETTGNEELWTQVWTNLVVNAIKFTPPGGRITVTLVGGSGWTAEVTDTGIGLDPADLSRVFERFYKADVARSVDNSSGSGLGLALVERIVTLHGARVEAISPGPGLGTTLRVCQPAGG